MNDNLDYQDPFYWDEIINGQTIRHLRGPSISHNTVTANIANIFYTHIKNLNNNKSDVFHVFTVRLSEINR